MGGEAEDSRSWQAGASELRAWPRWPGQVTGGQGVMVGGCPLELVPRAGGASLPPGLRSLDRQCRRHPGQSGLPARLSRQMQVRSERRSAVPAPSPSPDPTGSTSPCAHIPQAWPSPGFGAASSPELTLGHRSACSPLCPPSPSSWGAAGGGAGPGPHSATLPPLSPPGDGGEGARGCQEPWYL